MCANIADLSRDEAKRILRRLGSYLCKIAIHYFDCHLVSFFSVLVFN